MDSHEVVANILSHLMFNKGQVRIYLETPAMIKKNNSYSESRDLLKLFALIRKFDPNMDYFGLCIDSAHLWTAGVSMQSYEEADTYLKSFEEHSILPPSCIMFHLNDSERTFGHGPDSHAPLCLGHIWEKYRSTLKHSGIAAIVDFAKRHDSCVILERHSDINLLKNDYEILNELT